MGEAQNFSIFVLPGVWQGISKESYKRNTDWGVFYGEAWLCFKQSS